MGRSGRGVGVGLSGWGVGVGRSGWWGGGGAEWLGGRGGAGSRRGSSPITFGLYCGIHPMTC